MRRSPRHKEEGSTAGQGSGAAQTSFHRAQSPPGGGHRSKQTSAAPPARAPGPGPAIPRSRHPREPYVSLLAEEQESKSLAPASESPSSSSSSCEDRSPGSSAGRPRESRHAGSDIVRIARAPGGRTQTPAPASRTSSRAAMLPGRATWPRCSAAIGWSSGCPGDREASRWRRGALKRANVYFPQAVHSLLSVSSSRVWGVCFFRPFSFFFFLSRLVLFYFIFLIF